MPRNHAIAPGLTAAAVLAALAGRAAAQPVTWDGDCGNVWESFCSGGTVTNWDNDQLPQFSDNVTINGADVRINATVPQPVNEFTLFNGSLTGPLAPQGPSTCFGSGMNGVLEAGADFVFDGVSSFTGTLRGPGTYQSFGTLTVTGGFIGLGGPPTTLTISGDAVFSGAPDVTPGSTVEVFGTLTFASGGLDSTGLLDSIGTVRYNTLAGLAVVGTEFRNDGGTVEALAGTLRFSNTSTLRGGTLTAQPGAVIDFFGGFERPFTVTAGTTASGTGEVTLRPGGFGTLTLDAPFTFDLQAPGKGLIQGNVTLNADLRNSGYLQFDSARVSAGGGTIVNQPGGVMETVLNTAGQLATDAPVRNEGVLVTLSSIGTLASVPNTITNDTGGLWQMYKLPTGSMDVVNRGDIVHNRLNGNALGNGAVAGRFDQDNGSLASTVDVIYLEGGGTWTGDSSATITEDAELWFRAGDFTFQGDPVTLTARTPNDPGDAEILLDAPASYEISGRLLLDGSERGEFEQPPIRIAGALRGLGTLDNFGLAALTGEGHIGTPTSDLGTFRNRGQFELWGQQSADPAITWRTFNTGYFSVQGNATIARSKAENDRVWALENLGAPLTLTVTHEFQNNDLFVSDTMLSDPPIETTNTLRGPFNNQGVVHVRRNTNLAFDGDVRQIDNNVLTGGSWIIDPGCRLVFTEPFAIIGPAFVVGSTEELPQLATAEAVDGGTVEFGTPGILNEQGAFQVRNGGVLRSTDGDPIIAVGMISNGLPPTPESPDNDRSRFEFLQSLGSERLAADCPTDPAIVAPAFVNNAIIVPGPDGVTMGLIIQADTTLSSSSEIILDLAGPTPCLEHDQLLVDGPLTVSGTIRVAFAPGYEPLPTDTFSVIKSTSPIAGSIDRVLCPVFAGSKRLRAVVVGNTVSLVATCAADTNSDGVADNGDIGTYVTQFLAGDPAADFNGDGILDIGDIGAFVTTFLTGC